MKPQSTYKHCVLALVLGLLLACERGSPTGGTDVARQPQGHLAPAVPQEALRDFPPGVRFATLGASDENVEGLAGTTQTVQWYYILDQSTQRWYIVQPSTGAVLWLHRVDEATSFGIYWTPIHNYVASTSPGTQPYPDAGVNFSSITLSSDGRTVSFGNALSPSNPSAAAEHARSLANTSQPVLWLYVFHQTMNRWYVVSPTSLAVLLLDRVEKAKSFGIFWKPVHNWAASSSPATQGYADAGDNFTHVTISPSGDRVSFGNARSSSALADGQHVTVNGTVWMAFGGKRYGYQDWEAFVACTGANPSIAQSVSTVPQMPEGGILPRVASTTSDRYRWMSGQVPVKSSTSGAYYVVIGCVKSALTPTTLEQIFGPGGWGSVVTDDAINLLPEGPAALFPLRRTGTIIGAETVAGPVLWVTLAGGALGVPSEASLSSRCRNVVVRVSDADYQRYSQKAVLHTNTPACNTSTIAYQPDFLLPVPRGNYYLTQGAKGSFTHNGETLSYALDFLGTEGTPILAAAHGTVDHIGIYNNNCYHNPPCNGGGFGNYVVVRHSSGFTSRYMHMQAGSIAAAGISVGASVQRGQQIGKLGNTGYSTDPHIHIDVLYNDKGASSAVWLDQVTIDGRRIVDYERYRTYYSTNAQQ